MILQIIYYTIIQQCRTHKKLLIFFSTKPLENAILTRRKNTNGEQVNWLKICWIRVLENKPYIYCIKLQFMKMRSLKH